MNFPFFIAKRYLFSKKNRNAINIISGISVLVVAVSTAALIIVLSSINGFGKLIDEQISTFAPDLLLLPAKGKVFNTDNSSFDKIKKIDGIKYFAEINEDNILLKHNDRQLICRIKGVPEDYGKVFGIDTTVYYGVYKTHGNKQNFAVIGAGIAYEMGISVESGETVSLWIPNRKKIRIHNPEQSFNVVNVLPAGVISLDAEFDAKYLISSSRVVRQLTKRDSSEYSSVEILVDNESLIQEIKRRIENILGEKAIVKDKQEQFDVYRVMKSERLAAFIIMLFIVLIASFSIIGSVTMLIIEKKEDIFTLQSMGTKLKSIKRIFFTEGILISFTGAFLGIIFGGLISLGQEYFGFVTFPSDGNYIVEAYPIDVNTADLLLTFISVMFVGTLISLYPAMKLKSHINGKN
ncbi:MAG: ABC transporter permease [Bacteroidales bacterium]|nr:ABC transporter permease [Bacteroidales bacterium]